MRKYKVSTPVDGTFKVDADTGTQAKYDVSKRIRCTYPRLSIFSISQLLSAHLVEPKEKARLNAGRPKGSFNKMLLKLMDRNNR